MSDSRSLKPATVRRYLEALRAKQIVAAATELTYREPLADFLRSAATELGLGTVNVNAELSMPLAGKPDFQVANANGLGFRPLEHYLVDRKGRVLDAAQMEAFCRAVFAVEESLAVAAPMDEALSSVLRHSLELAVV